MVDYRSGKMSDINRIFQEGLKVPEIMEKEKDDLDLSDDEAFLNSGTCSLYNTKQENCPFFTKTGTCKFGKKCTKPHKKVLEPTCVIIHNLFYHERLGVAKEGSNTAGLGYEDVEMMIKYDEFYKDLIGLLLQIGNIKMFKCCQNYVPHLRGNVYVQYKEHSSAAKCVEIFNGRTYGGRNIIAETCEITSWESSICSLFYEYLCPRGDACNYLHVFENPDNAYPVHHRKDEPPPVQLQGQIQPKHKDPNDCTFFLKTGSCRFGKRCSKSHNFDNSTSTTILIQNMFADDRLKMANEDGKTFDEIELIKVFENFYSLLIDGFRAVGEVVNFKCCQNFVEHLRGNVYVQYATHADAMKAKNHFHGTYHGGRPLEVALTPIITWGSTICALWDKRMCCRIKGCNFLHVFRNPGNEYSVANRTDFNPVRTNGAYDNSKVNIDHPVLQYYLKRDGMHPKPWEEEGKQVYTAMTEDTQRKKNCIIVDGVERCGFYSKTGCCRFPKSKDGAATSYRCTYLHYCPPDTPTIMIQNFFRDTYERRKNGEPLVGEVTVIKDYEAFYDDIIPKFKSLGVVKNFKCSANVQMHLKGNVFVQFSSHQEAVRAMAELQGKYYDGKKLEICLSPVVSWKSAICGLYDKRLCPRGKSCNFLHVYRNPRNEFNVPNRTDFDPRSATKKQGYDASAVDVEHPVFVYYRDRDTDLVDEPKLESSKWDLKPSKETRGRSRSVERPREQSIERSRERPRERETTIHRKEQRSSGSLGIRKASPETMARYAHLGKNQKRRSPSPRPDRFHNAAPCRGFSKEARRSRSLEMHRSRSRSEEKHKKSRGGRSDCDSEDYRRNHSREHKKKEERRKRKGSEECESEERMVGRSKERNSEERKRRPSEERRANVQRKKTRWGNAEPESVEKENNKIVKTNYDVPLPSSSTSKTNPQNQQMAQAKLPTQMKPVAQRVDKPLLQVLKPVARPNMSMNPFIVQNLPPQATIFPPMINPPQILRPTNLQFIPAASQTIPMMPNMLQARFLTANQVPRVPGAPPSLVTATPQLAPPAQRIPPPSASPQLPSVTPQPKQLPPATPLQQQPSTLQQQQPQSQPSPVSNVASQFMPSHDTPGASLESTYVPTQNGGQILASEVVCASEIIADNLIRSTGKQPKGEVSYRIAREILSNELLRTLSVEEITRQANDIIEKRIRDQENPPAAVDDPLPVGDYPPPETDARAYMPSAGHDDRRIVSDDRDLYSRHTIDSRDLYPDEVPPFTDERNVVGSADLYADIGEYSRQDSADVYSQRTSRQVDDADVYERTDDAHYSREEGRSVDDQYPRDHSPANDYAYSTHERRDSPPLEDLRSRLASREETNKITISIQSGGKGGEGDRRIISKKDDQGRIVRAVSKYKVDNRPREQEVKSKPVSLPVTTKLKTPISSRAKPVTESSHDVSPARNETYPEGKRRNFIKNRNFDFEQSDRVSDERSPTSAYTRKDLPEYVRKELNAKKEHSGYPKKDKVYVKKENPSFVKEENSTYVKKEKQGYGKRESLGYPKSSGYVKKENPGFVKKTYPREENVGFIKKTYTREDYAQEVEGKRKGRINNRSYNQPPPPRKVFDPKYKLVKNKEEQESDIDIHQNTGYVRKNNFR